MTRTPQTPRVTEIENARQRRQNEARAVSDLAGHSMDYYRLPGALRAIVDAYRWADLAFIEASDAAHRAGDATPDQEGVTADQWALLQELERLAYHTRAELERHGVVEGALAWLATHPEGWDVEGALAWLATHPEGWDEHDDALDDAKHCRRCGALLMGAEQRGDVCNGCLGEPPAEREE